MSTVLLIHAGIGDRRQWRPQIEALEKAGHRVIAPELRGFGERPLGDEPFSNARDVEAELDGPAVVVGNSLGGRVALELALLRPDLVERLVVIAPGMPGWSWSEETRAGWAAEEKAFYAGDRSGAAEASMRMWVTDDAAGDVRDLVREMILRSYELQQEETAQEQPALDPPVQERLAEVACPTLVLVGDRDIPDMQAIAEHVAGSIAGARLVVIPGAAHLAGLEQPERVNAELIAFIGS